MFPIPLIAAVRACGARSSGADGAIARAATAAKSTGGGTEALIADVKYRAMFSAAGACSFWAWELGPVMCAAAPNLPMLIAGRALQSMDLVARHSEWSPLPTFRLRGARFFDRAAHSRGVLVNLPCQGPVTVPFFVF